MKYNTRPIDFTGCHPVIAEHLKRGEAIECLVWDGDRVNTQMTDFIISYMSTRDFQYRTAGSFYKNAEPITRKVRRIMPPERAIPTLIAEGWRFNQWGQMEHDDLPHKIILSGSYKMMGLTIEEAEKHPTFWPDCIIEEVGE